MHVIYWTDPVSGNLCVTSPVYASRPDGMTEEAFCDSERLRVVPAGVSYRVGDHTQCPADRTFRDAWTDEGTAIIVDMTRARAIHLAEIRKARNLELAKEDILMLRAIEAGDSSAQSEVAARKQLLRDIPATFDLATDVPDELKTKWPAELPARE